MLLPRRARPFILWLASLALLVGSLAPALSQLVLGNAGWVEVCTATGSQWLRADGAAPDQPAPASAHWQEHCPYCSLHLPALGLPPVLHVVALPAAGAGMLPPLLLHAPRPLFAWAGAQPRAPPVLC
jgi:hypothetical protein